MHVYGLSSIFFHAPKYFSRPGINKLNKITDQDCNRIKRYVEKQNIYVLEKIYVFFES